MASKQRRFADDGWGVWIEGDDTSTVYLNEWINPQGKTYVDFGIHSRGVRETKNLFVYIPFYVTEAEVEDLSLKLDNEGILCAVFSTTCWLDYKKNSCVSEVAFNGKTVDILHISCAGFTLQPVDEGTLIQVSLEKAQGYLDNDEIYILFRVPHKSLDAVLSRVKSPMKFFAHLKNLVTSPVVSVKYGYSVRINEARMLPEKIRKMGGFYRQKLKKAVVTIAVDESYDINDSNCYRVRRLEDKLYKTYAPNDFPRESAIIYQWNQTRERNLKRQFNFYIETSRQTISCASLIVYTIILLAIGAAGNGLWTLILYLVSLL